MRATARSEWIKFRSVRSGPAVLLATAVILPVTAWLLCAYYRNSWATMSPASKASFDPVFISLRGIEGAQLFVGALGVITATGEYTSGLIRSTFIATPQRAQVIALKATDIRGGRLGLVHAALVRCVLHRPGPAVEPREACRDR